MDGFINRNYITPMSQYIPVILGTAREGRNSLHAANYIVAELARAGHTPELIDVKDFPLTHTTKGATTPELISVSEKIKKADALVIVTPEYNHGYPGELKLFIDTFSTEYIGKPIGFVGVGALMGGSRAIEQLRQVAVGLGAFSIHAALYFPMAWTLFENGALKDPKAYEGRVKDFITEIEHAVKK